MDHRKEQQRRDIEEGGVSSSNRRSDSANDQEWEDMLMVAAEEREGAVMIFSSSSTCSYSDLEQKEVADALSAVPEEENIGYNKEEMQTATTTMTTRGDFENHSMPNGGGTREDEDDDEEITENLRRSQRPKQQQLKKKRSSKKHLEGKAYIRKSDTTLPESIAPGDDDCDDDTNPDDDDDEKPSPKWAIGGLCFMVLIVLGMVLGNKAAKTSTTTDANDDVDEVDHTLLFQCMTPFSNDTQILDRLATVVMVLMTDEEEEDLPLPCNNSIPLYVFQANTWMLQDPNLYQYTVERQMQRFALSMLYYSSTEEEEEGNNVSSWNNDTHWMSYDVDECQWYYNTRTSASSSSSAAVCEEDTNFLVELNLANNGLRGRLPLEELLLFLPPTLTDIDLSHNNLSGPIPSLPMLDTSDSSSNLLSLELHHNRLTGELPSSWATSLSKLQVLNLGGNVDLNGTIPIEWGPSFTDLLLLDISNTSVVGTLPAQLCTLQQQGQLQVVADCDDGSFHCCN